MNKFKIEMQNIFSDMMKTLGLDLEELTLLLMLSVPFYLLVLLMPLADIKLAMVFVEFQERFLVAGSLGIVTTGIQMGVGADKPCRTLVLSMLIILLGMMDQIILFYDFLNLPQ